jgi:hypothetical protein
MDGGTAVTKLNKYFSVMMFSTTSNVLFTCCVIGRQFLAATNLELQASENPSHVIGLLIFFMNFRPLKNGLFSTFLRLKMWQLSFESGIFMAAGRNILLILIQLTDVL